ncbi:MAG: hypothetical protein M1834_009681 [Cirrosporium novae-zelandiae]|nr:MAG: hypothetical protein M1834_009681 [Cirrosporium novae-zelandiae]
MAAEGGLHVRKASASRPSLAHIPHTPQHRNISSTFSSPGASFRNEDDGLIFEFGSRYFRAGFERESAPRCTFAFTPDEQRRVGDYRKWQCPRPKPRRRVRKLETWGKNYELWKMDVRDVDLGVVEDKIERAVREIHTKYLLIEKSPRRLDLIIPPLMPHPLLSTLLNTLFTQFRYPTINLLSTPVLSVVAAGVRSALVIDIGWAETIITGVYEYREVRHSRSVRAMKYLTFEMGKILNEKLREISSEAAETDHEDPESYIDEIGFDDIEDLTERVAWCNSFEEARASSKNELTMSETSMQSLEDSDFVLEIPDHPISSTLKVPFSTLAEAAETALFARNRSPRDLDDNERPLHSLAYKALLDLPLDARALCMSRVIITGGGSNIPGIKNRILDELKHLVEQRGWDPVDGEAAERRRSKMNTMNRLRQQAPQPVATKVTESTDEPPSPQLVQPAGLQEQEKDPIEDNLRKDALKAGFSPPVHGIVQGVETLGAWAGGSMIAGLKARGLVEIERDKFLQAGLLGANKEMEVSVLPKRQSYGHAIPKAIAGDRSTWTLGAWA